MLLDISADGEITSSGSVATPIKDYTLVNVPLDNTLVAMESRSPEPDIQSENLYRSRCRSLFVSSVRSDWRQIYRSSFCMRQLLTLALSQSPRRIVGLQRLKKKPRPDGFTNYSG